MIERQHQLEDALREAYWTMIKLAANRPVRNLDEQLASINLLLRHPLASPDGETAMRDDSPMAGHLTSNQARGVRFPRPAPNLDGDKESK